MMEALLILLFAVPVVILAVHEDWLHCDSPKFALGCLLASVAVASALLLLFLRGY